MDSDSRRHTLLAMAGAAAVSAILLAWAAAGIRPYAFYGWLRLIVGATSLYVAYTFWHYAPRIVGLGFLAVGFGGLIFFARMHREQWIPFDWAGAIVFAACAACGFYFSKRRPGSHDG